MLKLVIEGRELFDEQNQEFIIIEPLVLELEHSLISLSKWESKHLRPFLGSQEKTEAEIKSYIDCMIISEEIPEDYHASMRQREYDAVNDYIGSPYSGTTFHNLGKTPGGNRGETISAELIYYWLTAFQIPFQPAESWHLNRLFNLLRIASMKNTKQKPMPKAEQAAMNRSLNERRLAELGTSG